MSLWGHLFIEGSEMKLTIFKNVTSKNFNVT